MIVLTIKANIAQGRGIARIGIRVHTLGFYHDVHTGLGKIAFVTENMATVLIVDRVVPAFHHAFDQKLIDLYAVKALNRGRLLLIIA